MPDLLSAFEAASRRHETESHVIPPITDPLGKHWDQPKREEITVDETHAMMSQDAFDRLADYSCTMPSGVYEGKMWKCRKTYHDESKGWFLVWFGKSSSPKHVSNNYRTILIA